MKRSSVRRNLFLLFLTSVLTIAMSGCGVADVILSEQGIIEFGTGSFDDDIFNETNTFQQTDDILLQAELDEPFGTSEIEYILLKHNNGEEIYEQWVQTVDPSWDVIFSEYHEPTIDGELEKGDYTLRMFKNGGDLIAEGDFTVK